VASGWEVVGVMAIGMQEPAQAAALPALGAVLGMKAQGLGRQLGDSKDHNKIAGISRRERQLVYSSSSNTCSQLNWAYPVTNKGVSGESKRDTPR